MPWPRKTSTCRSFVTISSGLCRLLAIVVLLHGQNHTSRWTRSMGVDHSLPEHFGLLGHSTQLLHILIISTYNIDELSVRHPICRHSYIRNNHFSHTLKQR